MEVRDIPRTRPRSPGDIAQLVPYLIGFQPEESLVILVIDHGRLAVTARVDLDQMQHQQQLDQLINRIWTRFPGADAIALTYTVDHEAGWDTLTRFSASLPERADRTIMLVDGTTWHQPDGTTGVVDAYGHVATQATVAGLVTHQHRADLAPRLASAEMTRELTATVNRVLDRLPDPADNRRLVNAFTDLLVRNLPAPATDGRTTTRTMSSEDAIAMAILSQNPTVRDVALLALTRDTAEQHLQPWCDVINRTPVYGSEQPLHLAGMAAWIAGEGALATMALERAQALASPGGNSRSQLLNDLIDHVVPPASWEQLRADALTQAHPLVRNAVSGIAPPATGEPWETVNPPVHTTRHASRNPTPPAPGVAL